MDKIRENIIYFLDADKNLEMARRGNKNIITPNIGDVIFFEDYENTRFEVVGRNIKYLNNGYARFFVECKRL